MFEQLTERFGKILHDLRGYGKITEKNVAASLEDIRQALLAADVPVEVAEDFLSRVQSQALGETVMSSITPGQRMVKIVHDEMIHLLGGNPAEFRISHRPGVIILAGLQGSGKTTTAVKLAKRLTKEGKKVLLAACDTTRPAAMQQLEVLAKSAGLETFADPGQTDPVMLAGKALAAAKRDGFDVLIVDTAGRLHIDEPLMDQLVRIAQAVTPDQILLVVDAMIGQASLSLAKNYHASLRVTGFVLTKLEGDARVGAALSVRAVTNKPIFWAGVGEGIEDLEPFSPQSMASRILGMGDVVGLVQKAEQVLEIKEAQRLGEKVKASDLDLSDLLAQLQMIKNMGPIQNLLKMIPGAASLKDLKVSDDELTSAQAILQSMTPGERTSPEILDGSRRKRVSTGSGTSVMEVNRLLERFKTMKKMMKQMGQFQKRAGRFAGFPF